MMFEHIFLSDLLLGMAMDLYGGGGQMAMGLYGGGDMSSAPFPI